MIKKKPKSRKNEKSVREILEERARSFQNIKKEIIFQGFSYLERNEDKKLIKAILEFFKFKNENLILLKDRESIVLISFIRMKKDKIYYLLIQKYFKITGKRLLIEFL